MTWLYADESVLKNHTFDISTGKVHINKILHTRHWFV